MERGHAVHFRCFHPDCEGLRVDVMAKMRGVDEFEVLWERRTSAFDPDTDTEFELMSLSDLIRAKKTQRSKDWPMILAVVDAHFVQFGHEPTPERIRFWLQESRTPAVSKQFAEAKVEREAAVLAREGANETQIEAALKAEEERERALDRAYWAPLKAELEQLR